MTFFQSPQKCQPRCDDAPLPYHGVAAVRRTLEMLGRPEMVDYVALCDAHPRGEDGEDGHQWFIEHNIDITCHCILDAALRICGYEPVITDGAYRGHRRAS